MRQPLNQTQLQQIITKVGVFEGQKKAEFDRKQVERILEELSIPKELLDEVMIQLSHHQGSVQRRRNRWIVGGVIAAVVVAIASTIYYSTQQNNILLPASKPNKTG